MLAHIGVDLANIQEAATEAERRGREMAKAYALSCQVFHEGPETPARLAQDLRQPIRPALVGKMKRERSVGAPTTLALIVCGGKTAYLAPWGSGAR